MQKQWRVAEKVELIPAGKEQRTEDAHDTAVSFCFVLFRSVLFCSVLSGAAIKPRPRTAAEAKQYLERLV